MTEQVDCVVIGAGVVGLAVARQLARAGREVLILESETSIGTGVSSRNSEVIHAGLYYPPATLKARLCVEGRDLLYPFLDEHQVPYRKCGKLVVANSAAQSAELVAIMQNALTCGVTDLQLLDQRQVQALEPALQCDAALLSPSSGIVDSHALMLALLGDAERAGAMLAVQSPVKKGQVTRDGMLLTVGEDAATEIVAAIVVNAAGLFAQQVALAIGTDAAHVPEQRLAKGNYFSLSGKCPFSHLIYPVPEPGGLGVHLTLDLAGQAKFGPDVEWVEQLDYIVDETRSASFAAKVQAYWPGMDATRLAPAYAGIRPKLKTAPGQTADFRIDGPERHGIAGLVQLFGIESPGLTASLAIAACVAERLLA